jgi:hypothetical protein
MLHPLPVGGKTSWAIKAVNRPVERGMRGAQVGGHQVGVTSTVSIVCPCFRRHNCGAILSVRLLSGAVAFDGGIQFPPSICFLLLVTQRPDEPCPRITFKVNAPARGIA